MIFLHAALIATLLITFRCYAAIAYAADALADVFMTISATATPCFHDFPMLSPLAIFFFDVAMPFRRCASAAYATPFFIIIFIIAAMPYIFIFDMPR